MHTRYAIAASIAKQAVATSVACAGAVARDGFVSKACRIGSTDVFRLDGFGRNYLFKFVVAVNILGVVWLQLQSKFQLLFAFQKPVVFVKDNGL